MEKLFSTHRKTIREQIVHYPLVAFVALVYRISTDILISSGGKNEKKATMGSDRINNDRWGTGGIPKQKGYYEMIGDQSKHVKKKVGYCENRIRCLGWNCTGGFVSGYGISSGIFPFVRGCMVSCTLADCYLHCRCTSSWNL